MISKSDQCQLSGRACPTPARGQKEQLCIAITITNCFLVGSEVIFMPGPESLVKSPWLGKSYRSSGLFTRMSKVRNINQVAEENIVKLPAQVLQKKSDSAISNSQRPWTFSLHIRIGKGWLSLPSRILTHSEGKKLFNVLSFPCQLLPSSKFYKGWCHTACSKKRETRHSAPCSHNSADCARSPYHLGILTWA